MHTQEFLNGFIAGLSVVTGSSQSDMGVNDPTKPSYVKNRAFFVEEVTTDYYTLTNTGEDLSIIDKPLGLVAGTTYTVDFLLKGQVVSSVQATAVKASVIEEGIPDGIIALVCDEYLIVIDNCALDPDGNFILADSAVYSYSLMPSESDEATLNGVQGTITVIHKLDNKFLNIDDVYNSESHNPQSGTAVAEAILKAIEGYKVPNDSIITDMLTDSVVTTKKIANAAVTADKLVNAAVTANKLADNAVTNYKIADNAVTNYKIAAKAVTTEKLGRFAVCRDAIATREVTREKIGGYIRTASHTVTESVSFMSIGSTFMSKVSGGLQSEILLFSSDTSTELQTLLLETYYYDATQHKYIFNEVASAVLDFSKSSSYKIFIESTPIVDSSTDLTYQVTYEVLHITVAPANDMSSPVYINTLKVDKYNDSLSLDLSVSIGDKVNQLIAAGSTYTTFYF